MIHVNSWLLYTSWAKSSPGVGSGPSCQNWCLWFNARFFWPRRSSLIIDIWFASECSSPLICCSGEAWKSRVTALSFAAALQFPVKEGFPATWMEGRLSYIFHRWLMFNGCIANTAHEWKHAGFRLAPRSCLFNFDWLFVRGLQLAFHACLISRCSCGES